MRYDDLENSTQIILKVAFAFLVLVFLWAVRDIVLLLLLSLILASAAEPFVSYLHSKNIPRIISVLIVYVVAVGLAALVIALIIPPVIQQYQILSLNFPHYISSLQSRLGSSLNVSDFWNQWISGTASGGGLINSTFGIFNGFISFVSVVVISFYLVAEEKGMKTFVSSFLPERHHGFTLGLLEKIQKKMGLWILGQLGVSISIFILVFASMSLLHVQYALFLALIAGLLEIMPYIGPILSGIAGMFFAFIQHPPLAIAAGIVYLIIHQIEGYVLVPKIMQRAVGTSPLLVLVALLVGFRLAGVLGLIIAVPLSTALTVVVNEFWPSTKIP